MKLDRRFYAHKNDRTKEWEVWVSYVGSVYDVKVCTAVSEEVARETVLDLERAVDS